MARAAQLRSTSRLRRNAGRGDGKGSLSHGHPIGNGSALDALAFLNRDHRELAELFDRYALARRTLAAPERRALALKICTALTLHARLEDELFYPTVRKNVSGVDELINDASVEHATIKGLVMSIQDHESIDGLFDAKVKVLGDYVRHHICDEQDKLFAKVRQADIDLREFGARLAERKSELAGEAGPPN